MSQVLLDPSEEVDKCVQLYETMQTRHTTMVVGNTGGGKSVIINTLARAQTKIGNHTKLFILNPKAQSVAELYGVMDPDTRDWTDGLLSSIFREINKPLPNPDKEESRWIVLDGDVDAVSDIGSINPSIDRSNYPSSNRSIRGVGLVDRSIKPSILRSIN